MRFPSTPEKLWANDPITWLAPALTAVSVDATQVGLHQSLQTIQEIRLVGGMSERAKEIRRRRHRKQKLTKLKAKAEKGSVADKVAIAEKIRKLTPGAETIIARWELEER